MSLILHTTNCPQCTVLKAKLDEAHIEYTENHDVESMLAKGIRTAPCLEDTEKDLLMTFTESIKFAKIKGGADV